MEKSTSSADDGMDLNSLSLYGRSESVEEQREDYLSWDEYFMAVAFLSAQRSKDPATQV